MKLTKEEYRKITKMISEIYFRKTYKKLVADWLKIDKRIRNN